jgi:SAM-dependent methyltransferase
MQEGPPQTRDLHNFAAVDQTTDVSALVAALDLAHSLPFYLDVNRQSYARLHVQPGHHLLDVGCGAGTDVQALARLVGPTGQVVGLDVSAAMIEEARRRAASSGLPLAIRVGDVRQIDDADTVFDGCRSARVLCFQPEPAQVVAELARVIRVGGHLVAFEPECESLIIDAADLALTRRFTAFWRDGFPSGCVARHLPAVFAACGLVDVAVTPHTLIFRDATLFFHRLFLFADTVRKACESGVATPQDGHQWQAALEAQGARGQFFAAFTFYMVSGRKA